MTVAPAARQPADAPPVTALPGDRPSLPPHMLPPFGPPGDDDDAEGFAALLAQVERDRGFRVLSYKERCLRRRVAVRMRATGTHRFADYARRLTEEPREYERLLDALTINVTKLFRNWDAWAALDALVLPGLVARGGPVRTWSAGCASGEEAYSLAALLHARAERAAGGPGAELRAPPYVLGTDVDRATLGAAAAGVYGGPAFHDTPPALRARYFPPALGAAPGSPTPAAPELRALVHFASHDLLRDPPPAGPWDVIACRNVVIYFDRAAQEALFERFHAALAPGGVLFLGKVETLLGPQRALFTPVDARQRLFRRA